MEEFDSVLNLPWQPCIRPIMLAPMQGLTNSGLRELFARWVFPDTMFTEFIRVASGETSKRLSPSDMKEMAPTEHGIPLVVQLIGHGIAPVVSAARIAQSAGACHINLNLGCPYGRMTSGLTGGGILKEPEQLKELIPALRDAVKGSFSIKLRAGHHDLNQIFSLLPLFEKSRVDFIVLHPRTVLQEYEGRADHTITEKVVRETGIPVIANGDVRTASQGIEILERTGAAGLMLGRGAIANPLLFSQIREAITTPANRSQKAAMLRFYLKELLTRYEGLFCGESQILGKVKSVFPTMDDPDFTKQIKTLKKAVKVEQFKRIIEEIQ